MAEKRQACKRPASPARHRLQRADIPWAQTLGYERQTKRTKTSPLQLATPDSLVEDSLEYRSRDEVANGTAGGDEDKMHDGTANDTRNAPRLPDEAECVTQIERKDINWAIAFPADQGRMCFEKLRNEPEGKKRSQVAGEKRAHNEHGSKQYKKKVKIRFVQDRSPLFRVCRSKGEDKEVFEFPAAVRHEIWRHLLKSKDGILLGRNTQPGSNGREHLHLAIMSTCRDIYAETMRVLYMENQILVHTEDIFHLEGQWSNIPSFPELEMPRQSIWRHNPLGGVGGLVEHPAVKNHWIREYDSPALNGYVEPHVFSRFQHVIFLMTVLELDLGGIKFIPDTPKIDSLFVDKPYEMKTQFLLFKGRVDVVRTLGRILANSPYIFDLTVAIQIRGSMTDPKKGAKIAIQRLGERFTDYQSFGPLLSLTNIRNFSPVIRLFHKPSSRQSRGPSPSMARTLELWKHHVEGQWLSPQVRQWLRYSEERTTCHSKAFAQYAMPFRAKYYGLKAKRLGRRMNDERYGEVGFAVENRSSLVWGEVEVEVDVGFAEAQRLGRRGQVSVEGASSTTTPSRPPLSSSVLPQSSSLPLYPCDGCVVKPELVALPCPKPCHCDDCFVPPAPKLPSLEEAEGYIHHDDIRVKDGELEEMETKDADLAYMRPG